MIKNSVLLLIAAVFLSGKKVDSDPRTTYFPKVEVKVSVLPQKQRVWVFLLAGQSNMAGRGEVEPTDTIPSNRIMTINKENKLILAKEPLHFYEPSLTGLDCGLSFGKELIKHIPDTISILILPTAVGGSSISQWLGDDTHRNVPLYSNFIEKVSIGKEFGTVKGILWHQGESDANDADIAVYKGRLTELIKKFRQTVGDENLPVLIGELGSYSATNEKWQAINRQIAQYVLTDPHALVIKTSDLKHKGDQVHFDSKGQRKLGQRFAKEYFRNKKHFLR